TLRQFLMLLMPGALVFILYFFLQLVLWVMMTVVAMGLAVIVTFVKVHERPMYQLALAAFGYVVKPHLYLWRSVTPPSPAPPPAKTAAEKAPQNTLSRLAGKINIFRN
ncbi:MAG: hypothetical protein U1A16_02260, partial [Patescibacteria group bacterium]|nr:hypothetical protein [Patescibacteria group bacterium]